MSGGWKNEDGDNGLFDTDRLGNGGRTMTVHDNYTHQCPKCEAYYIPYDDVPCPRCGLVETERYDFIPIALASVRWNIEMYGFYVPGAWFVGGLGDHLLLILFHIFER
jgi:hypothetical protein